MKKAPPVVNLFPYQHCWVDDLSQFKIADKARQIGLTYAETLSIVQRLMAKKAKWYYLSSNEDRAREAIEYAVEWALTIGVALSSQNIAVDFFEDTKLLKLTLHFPNGSKMIALPANHRTARGASGNITLDEFGHHINAYAIWQAAHAIAVNWGYNLHVISTPNGLQGMYAKLWTGMEKELSPEAIEDAIREGKDIVRDDWSRHLTNVYDAAEQRQELVNAGLVKPLDVEKCRRLAGDEDTFQQEYMCKFLDEAYAWLPFSLIGDCTHEKATIHWDSTQKPAGPLFGGLDIGRKQDLSSLWIDELRSDTLWTRGVISMRKETFTAQKQTINGIMPFLSMLHADETGIGAQLVEELIDYWGESRVEGISFTGDRPAKLATKFRAYLESGRKKLPDDPVVRRHLHMVRRTYTDMGKVRFEAPRTRDGHADHFWSGALCVDAADSAPQAMGVGDYKSGSPASQYLAPSNPMPRDTFNTRPSERQKARDMISQAEKDWRGF